MDLATMFSTFLFLEILGELRIGRFHCSVSSTVVRRYGVSLGFKSKWDKSSTDFFFYAILWLIFIWMHRIHSKFKHAALLGSIKKITTHDSHLHKVWFLKGSRNIGNRRIPFKYFLFAIFCCFGIFLSVLLLCWSTWICLCFRLVFFTSLN